MQTTSTLVQLTPHSPPIVNTTYGNGTSNDGNFAATTLSGYYLLLLDRYPSTAEVNAWTNLVLSGTSLQTVATDIFHSTEYLSDTVASYYTTYLGRTGSAAEINPWVTLLGRGALSQEQVATDFLDSAEFSADHPDNSDFTQTLYLDVLGRTAAPSEVSAWDTLLGSGTSRSTEVSLIVNSTESLTRAISSNYTTLLARQASPAEIDDWLPLLAEDGGTYTLADVALAVATSTEWYDRVGTFL